MEKIKFLGIEVEPEKFGTLVDEFLTIVKKDEKLRKKCLKELGESDGVDDDRIRAEVKRLLEK